MIIPTRNAPRYRYLLQIKEDIWGTLTTKKLYNKKWRELIDNLKQKEKFESTKSLLRPINYNLPPLVDWGWIFGQRAYKTTLLYRHMFKFRYGCLQDYKVKTAVNQCHGKGWMGFLKQIEANTVVFFHRCGFSSTLKQSHYQYKKKYYSVNGNTQTKNFGKGSILRFSKNFEGFVRRKLNSKKLNKTFPPSWIEIDSQSLRMYLWKEFEPIRTPFFINYQRIWRWYVL